MKQANLSVAAVLHDITCSLPDWQGSVQCGAVSPDGTQLALFQHRDGRRLAFLLISALGHSVLPLFSLNSQLKGWGFETVALFLSSSFPSTTHLPCAALELVDQRIVATLICNPSPVSEVHRFSSQLGGLIKAAADSRIKRQVIYPHQQVLITARMLAIPCEHCGHHRAAFTKVRLQTTCTAALSPIVLGSSQIHRGLQAQLVAFARNALNPGCDDESPICSTCVHAPNHLVGGVRSELQIDGEAELSSLTTLELLKAHTPTWYIQPHHPAERSAHARTGTAVQTQDSDLRIA